MPAGVLRVHERVYPFGWLGILAKVAPASHELIYTYHQRGFALLSMRSPEISRLYLQCDPEEDIAEWSDDRIWTELRTRMATRDGWKLVDGPVLQKGITPMRSFVAEPMQPRQAVSARRRRAHRSANRGEGTKPCGGRRSGLDARAGRVSIKGGSSEGLDRYSDTCLRRVWKVQRFSWWMTSMLHRFPNEDSFQRHLHLAELDYVTSSRAAATALAENYVGLPFDQSANPV